MVIFENNLKLKYMELELKHIAPYLPYNLKLDTPNGIITEYTLSTNGDVRHFCKDWLVYDYKISDIKPILRPMCDLTKEVNGVIPIVELYKLSNEYNSGVRLKYKFIDSFVGGKVLKISHSDGSYTEFIYSNLEFRKEIIHPKGAYIYGMNIPGQVYVGSRVHNSYRLFGYLLENHFDIFGLIDEGLAIDKNTL